MIGGTLHSWKRWDSAGVGGQVPGGKPSQTPTGFYLPLLVSCGIEFPSKVNLFYKIPRPSPLTSPASFLSFSSSLYKNKKIREVLWMTWSIAKHTEFFWRHGGIFWVDSTLQLPEQTLTGFCIGHPTVSNFVCSKHRSSWKHLTILQSSHISLNTRNKIRFQMNLQLQERNVSLDAVLFSYKHYCVFLRRPPVNALFATIIVFYI